MEGLHIFLALLFGVVSYSHGQLSGPVLEVTVRPGDNITLYCDCKLSTGVYIMWYRNCSHENQPPLVLKTYRDTQRQISNAANYLSPLPRLHFVRNYSSESYDLLIMNSTESDEGLYYCGTEKMKVEDKEHITAQYDYRYGNVTTRIIIKSSEPGHHGETPDATLSSTNCALYRMLLFSLCPALAVLSSLLSSLVVYRLCSKKTKEPQADQKKPSDTRGQSRLNRDEDVCYAALEIRQPSQRQKKKKKTQSSDFSTYSAINTSRM